MYIYVYKMYKYIYIYVLYMPYRHRRVFRIWLDNILHYILSKYIIIFVGCNLVSEELSSESSISTL